MTENPHRLPRTVVPSHYELRIEPDLEQHRFEGSVAIDLDVDEPVDSITLHAVDLEIRAARVIAQNDRVPAIGVAEDAELQRITISFGSDIPAGSHRLEIEFAGAIDERLHGFYRSSFTDDDGVTHTIATTQMQATDARRAFPCFDEPSMKASFGITLVVPEDLFAVSNSEVAERTPLGDGRVEIRFADTMRMSTYLVAYVIGPFQATEPVDVGGVPLRVISRAGTEQLTGFALEAGAFCLAWLRDYYGIPYPGDKVDLIAIPDFAAGAMENLGCVTFRETALLADRSTATQAELLRVLDVVAHELAHMWFGDLVTMEWWDGIWLNEAFATFMEMKATDAMKPEWKRWSSFGATERPWALGVDGLRSSRPVEFTVGSPEEANEMFDALTYGKGSSVLRMLEQFLGEEVFRAGVGDYLRRHAHANTVTSDLWHALDEASGRNVGEIMDTWILQEGHPRVAVSVDGSTVTLAQSRYLTLPDPSDERSWKVPLQLRGTIDGRPFRIRHLLETSAEQIVLDAPPDWIVGNAGGHGYYRTDYDGSAFDAIRSNLARLDDLERFVTVHDAWAFVESGARTVSEYLDLVEAYRAEPELAIWQAISAALGQIRHHVVTDEALAGYGRRVTEIQGPLLERLGWQPIDGESALDRRLRGLAITAMGRVAADPATIERAIPLAWTWLDDPTAVDPDVGQASLAVLASASDASVVEGLFTARKRSRTPQIELRILQAITLVDDPDAVDATIAATHDGRIRSQDVTWVYASMLGRRNSGGHAWGRLEAEWPKLRESMTSMTLRRAVEGVPALSEPSTAERVEAFFEANPTPAVATSVAQNLERLRANRALRSRERQRFSATLR